MTSINQYNFVDFCSACERRKRQIVRDVHEPSANEKKGNHYLYLYNLVTDFCRRNSRETCDWHFFDEFLTRYPDCREKIDSLREIFGRFDSVEYSKEPSGSWGLEGITVKIRPTMKLILNGNCHLIKLNLSRTHFSERKRQNHLHLIGLACVCPEEPTFLSAWDLGYSDERRIQTISSSQLDPNVIEQMRENLRLFSQYEREMYPETVAFPTTETDQDIAA